MKPFIACWASFVSVSLVFGQANGTFVPTGKMTTARVSHSATLLPGGKVLITGAYYELGAYVASAELYDPVTGTFTTTGDMTKPRIRPATALLPDGRVLIAGGEAGAASVPGSAELYDPSTGMFTAAENMTFAFNASTATVLADGRVLIVGGAPPLPYLTEIRAEIYEPTTGRFSAAGVWTGLGYPFTATLLPDGKVFVVPLYYSGIALIYDPATAILTSTGPRPTTRWPPNGSAVLLSNGKVLLAGGVDDPGPIADVEPYDPSTRIFSAARRMATARDQHTATLLADGTVLISGGEMWPTILDNAEVFDPAFEKFSSTGKMTTARTGHSATLLLDGSVLIIGGWRVPREASAERYYPAVPRRLATLLTLPGASRQGAILHASTHQVVSPSNPAASGEALEIYCTGLTEGSPVPPQVAIGGRMAELLYFGGAPGYPGLNQVNVRVPGGIGTGSDVPVRLTYFSRPSNEVMVSVR